MSFRLIKNLLQRPESFAARKTVKDAMRQKRSADFLTAPGMDMTGKWDKNRAKSCADGPDDLNDTDKSAIEGGNPIYDKTTVNNCE